MPLERFNVFSYTQGPDGNGLIDLTDPAFGGLKGTVTTNNNSPTISSVGFLLPDKMVSRVTAFVIAREGAPPNAPTDGWSAIASATFFRDGNNLTQRGTGSCGDVHSEPSLAACLAMWVIDTSKTPHLATIQVKGMTGKNLLWSWGAPLPWSY